MWGRKGSYAEATDSAIEFYSLDRSGYPSSQQSIQKLSDEYVSYLIVNAAV